MTIYEKFNAIKVDQNGYLCIPNAVINLGEIECFNVDVDYEKCTTLRMKSGDTWILVDTPIGYVKETIIALTDGVLMNFCPN